MDPEDDTRPELPTEADREDASGGGSDVTSSSSSLAFLRAVARAPEVVPVTPADVDESGALLAAGEDPPRFELRRRLGSGGFGTVYEAADRKRGATCALKVLRRTDAQAIYLFKQEFRSLAGIVHPRLVRLDELHQDGQRWFFTMELIAGRDVIAHVRDGDRVDVARVRLAFQEITEGLAFLHEAGKLHRDVKPSNVMVDDAGAVKILDFGLVADLDDTAPAARIAGTPSYMAPEQAAGVPIGPAADFYAVGVMLCQALTGKLPARDAATSPRAIAPDMPEDLDRLCRDLLAPDPATRPTASEIIARIQGQREPATMSRRPPAAPFVGRDRELEQLGSALAEARAGQTVVALVRGSSGIGKSALVQRFLESIADDKAVLPLAGRCFQQESVPYKALDSVIDALGRRLGQATAEETEAWIPREAAALGRVFPVLRQVPAIAVAAHTDEDESEIEVRHRAFAALRELVARVARARTPVITVDDVQWGDLDSVALLVELIRPPAAPPLLVIASYRAEEAATSPVLRALQTALRGELEGGVLVREIDVGALPPADAEALAVAVLAGVEGADRDRAKRIAAEAHHSPFFIHELARLPDDLGGAREGEAVDLGARISARLARLPEPARRLLEVVAVAGNPVSRVIAARAAQGEGEALDEPEAISLLVAGRALRVQDARDREELLPYHDRIREAVVAALPDARRREHHHRLARALQAAENAEPSLLVHHLREAGLAEEAATYALAAAEQARAALAFDQAARYFREALTPGALDASAARAARIGLAAALAGAGRPRDAAAAYLDLAAREAPREAHSHRRQAMHLLLAGGYLDEGLSVLDGVLAELGIARPSSIPSVLAELFRLRAALRRRGLDFRERRESEIPERLLLEVDACYSAAASLGVTSPLQVAPFQARQLLLALEAGEPSRVARALTLESIQLALRAGHRDDGLGDDLLQRIEQIAARPDFPEAQYFLRLARSIGTFLRGDVERAEPLLRASIAELGAHRSGGGSGVDLANALLATTLWARGKIPDLAAVTADLLADARERGNRYRETMIRLSTVYLLDLAAGRPDAARATLEAAMARWPRAGDHIQHQRERFARAQIALYQGDGPEALRVLAAGIPSLFGSGVVLLPVLRAQIHHLRAVAALAVATRGGLAARGLHALALRDARALERCPVRWCPPVGWMIRAGVAAQRGRMAEAVDRFSAAEAELDRVGMSLYAAVAKRRRGTSIGGTEGAALVAATDAWMKARTIQDPARVSATLAG
ncbi:Serine/threonine-protein kinase pkn3 [Minicystis rosea]|nr:Serine/threonine-protein kinase pkn3 [Minicystis rosea]